MQEIAPGEILRAAGAFVDFDYDGIVIVNRDGIVVSVNQAFADVLDTPSQAIIGKHVYHAYPNSQSSRLPAVMETGSPQLGITHMLNGKQVYASLYPLVSDSNVIGGIGKIVFKDVREIALIANRLQSAPETRGVAATMARQGSATSFDINSIVGQSSKMLQLKESLLRVARKSSNVLLRGESGTGKELFAHALHAASPRRYAQFVKVNCAAIPEHLLESELFGYAEGAFTGAKRGGHLGKFGQAHNGTIFLDEIGDMPLYMQAKLLRVLQDKELTQLGSNIPKNVNVRVVAATNSNLEQLVKEGKFREDLYYRLNVVNLTVPSLRERMEDVPALAASFIDHFNAEFGLQVRGLDDDARDVIMRYRWPGNVRELRNVVESAFNAVSGEFLEKSHLPEQLLSAVSDDTAAPTSCEVDDYIRERLGHMPLEQIVDDFEKLVLEAAVSSSRGNRLRAANVLGISRQWLYKKLQRSVAVERRRS
jgi:transcriptional regulator with PAS, ATPase and Fis domain